ncbi:MAG TPA: TIM barrel protein, partial [Solirubrobacterales bacterium]|nr:TIM barrel protein [Solirubrobacterales bacterium]
MRIATAPGTWGVEPPASDPGVPRWERVLDEIAEAGFDGSELGPLGYLPAPPTLGRALRERGLSMPAGFVMEPLSIAEETERVARVAGETCSALSSVGAEILILIDGLSPERSATAGRASDARRLSVRGWDQLIATCDAVAAIAAESGLRVAFHPHAGTNVEFRDEIDRLMDDLDALNVGLCLDTGHAIYAGIDPVALIAAHHRRLLHVHLKDVDAAVLAAAVRDGGSFEQAVSAGVFTPLGEGSVDLEAVAEAL